MLCNTVIFYDIENLLAMFADKKNTTLNLSEIYRRVLEIEGVEGVSIQRAYADWALPIPRHLRNSVLQMGIEPVQVFNSNPYDKVKNASDVNLIIDVVDLIAKRPEIEFYVIASGDGIFTFLAKKLHEYGKRVIGCGFDKITNSIFRAACDHFISLEKNEKILYTHKRNINDDTPTDVMVVADTPAKPTNSPSPKTVPVKSKIPAPKFPKTKYSEVLQQSNLQIWKDTGDTAGCMHMFKTLLETMFVEETRSLVDMEVSIFMTYVNYYIPNFKATKHGFKSLVDFLQFVLTGSPFCIYSVKENVLRIAPRDLASNTPLDDVEGILIVCEDGSRHESLFTVPDEASFIYTIQEEKNEPIVIADEKIEKTEKTEKVAKVERITKVKKAEKSNKPNKTEKLEKIEKIETVEAPKVEKVEKPSVLRNKKKRPEQTPPPAPLKVVEPATISMEADDGSIRRYAKNVFIELSESDALSTSEVKRLTTAEYAKTTFGIRSPVLREVNSRSNIEEERMSNGKPKYWKELFTFGRKTYIVYKEWAEPSRERITTWFESVKPKSRR